MNLRDLSPQLKQKSTLMLPLRISLLSLEKVSSVRLLHLAAISPSMSSSAHWSYYRKKGSKYLNTLQWKVVWYKIIRSREEHVSLLASTVNMPDVLLSTIMSNQAQRRL